MIKNIICFVAGAAAGAFVASLYVKEKYESLADEAVESVKQAYGFYDEPEEEETEEDDQNKIISNEEASMYRKISKEQGYSEYDKAFVERGGFEDLRGNYFDGGLGLADFPTQTAAENEHPTEDEKRPCVITAEEYDADQLVLNEHQEEIQVPLYDKISLVYYEGDNVLAEELNNTPVDIEETIGYEALNRFGEFRADTVFVRNERLGADYEVIRDRGSYSKSMGY